MLKVKYFLVIVLIISCDLPQKIKDKVDPKSYNNPYEVFYSKLNNLKLTDTVLVQSQTKIFGCGTAALEYYSNLEVKGLDKFYDKYGTLFAKTNLLEEFEKQNNTKIVWVDRGNGELFKLENEDLKSNDSLVKRLRKEKDFIVFEDTPNSLQSLSASIKISKPSTKTTKIKTYIIGLKHLGWTSVLIKDEELKGTNYY